jgi:hypothetical protein
MKGAAMKRVILIFEDSPRAKELAAQFRANKIAAQIRNPMMWIKPGEDAHGRTVLAEGAHGAVVPLDAPNGDSIAATYAAAGVPVRRDMAVFNPDETMPEAAAKADKTAPDAGPAIVAIPDNWQALKPWTKKVSLAKQINANFEPDPKDRVASAERVIQAEIDRREAETEMASFPG